mgnify:CR=1 FL=1
MSRLRQQIKLPTDLVAEIQKIKDKKHRNAWRKHFKNDYAVKKMYEEFLEEIEKGDMDEAFAEYSDVEGHVAYWLYTNHGIEVPMYNTIHVEKTRKRVEVFADIFAQFGLEMDSKYLKGGSNFQKTTKVRLALETAAKDQGKSFNATDEEIKEFMVARYGRYVLYNPPLDKHTLILWFGPAVLLIFGGIFVGFRIRQSKKALEAGESQT